MIISERIYIAQAVQPARRAFSNGIISAAQSAGSVAGPAVGSVAAAIGGLRAPFVLVAVTSAIAFVGTLFLPAPNSDARREAEAASRAGRSRSRPGARRAARRQHRAPGELRRVHHDLRPDGHRPPRLVDRGGRHRLLVLRRRQHRPRAMAGAHGRPSRASPNRGPGAGAACGLRDRARGGPPAARRVCAGLHRRRRAHSLLGLVVRPPGRDGRRTSPEPHVRHHQRRLDDRDRHRRPGSRRAVDASRHLGRHAPRRAHATRRVRGNARLPTAARYPPPHDRRPPAASRSRRVRRAPARARSGSLGQPTRRWPGRGRGPRPGRRRDGGCALLRRGARRCGHRQPR